MEQETTQDERVTYFVVFKHQPGEVEPAYSYMDKDDLEQATHQGIIDKAYIVPTKSIQSPEDTLMHLHVYKQEGNQTT